MAKGSAMGLWKGKKGSSVFYKIAYSNNKERQGIREYQPEVRNPQTNGQADQRMKMLSAQLVKGALRDIVSRSFQGIPYGAQSRMEFMKYALRAEIFPFLPKGWTDPVPGGYLVSRGTLAPVVCSFDENEPGFIFQITYGEEIDKGSVTEGTLARVILESNPNFREGDQLTFIACQYWSDFFPHCEWIYYSILLDPNSTRTMISDGGFYKATLAQKTGAGETSRLMITGEADNLIAATCIHSRMGADGLYLRSTQEMTLARDWLPEFDSYFSAAAKGVARASYQTKTRGYETDWPVEESAEIAGTIDGLYTLSGLTGNLASLNGRKVQVRVNETTGALRAVYVTTYLSELGALVGEDGNVITYQVGQDVLALRQENVPALSSLPTIVYGTQAGRMAATIAAPAVEEPAPAEKKTTKKK